MVYRVCAISAARLVIYIPHLDSQDVTYTAYLVLFIRYVLYCIEVPSIIPLQRPPPSQLSMIAN